jgi:hypothetical protein
LIASTPGSTQRSEFCRPRFSRFFSPGSTPLACDHDHSGYWLLWGLTVYSAITQPALAYSGAVNARSMDSMLAKMESLEEQNAQLLAIVASHLGEPPQ